MHILCMSYVFIEVHRTVNTYRKNHDGCPNIYNYTVLWLIHQNIVCAEFSIKFVPQSHLTNLNNIEETNLLLTQCDKRIKQIVQKSPMISSMSGNPLFRSDDMSWLQLLLLIIILIILLLHLLLLLLPILLLLLLLIDNIWL